MTKIIVLGGTGYLGSVVVPQLAAAGYVTLVMSRRAERYGTTHVLPGVAWQNADVTVPGPWQAQLPNADWVIDLVGILKENKAGGVTFERFINQPVKLTLASGPTPPYFLFVSANWAPFPAYLAAKREADALVHAHGGVSLYPGLITDPSQRGSFMAAKCLTALRWLPGLGSLYRHVRPVTRHRMGEAILHVLQGMPETLTQVQR